MAKQLITVGIVVKERVGADYLSVRSYCPTLSFGPLTYTVDLERKTLDEIKCCARILARELVEAGCTTEINFCPKVSK